MKGIFNLFLRRAPEVCRENEARTTFLTVLNVLREYVIACFVPTGLQACADHPLTTSLNLTTLLSGALLLCLLVYAGWVLGRAVFSPSDMISIISTT